MLRNAGRPVAPAVFHRSRSSRRTPRVYVEKSACINNILFKYVWIRFRVGPRPRAGIDASSYLRIHVRVQSKNNPLLRESLISPPRRGDCLVLFLSKYVLHRNSVKCTHFACNCFYLNCLRVLNIYTSVFIV